ncbi:hypothetical protein tb265_15780 [Gemmatimonadetes bacterium T265]|nr:hypothetical protein tb265_15780 [Gemmatimonadetes bacterium T265]
MTGQFAEAGDGATALALPTVDDREAAYWDAQAARVSDDDLRRIPNTGDALAVRALALLGDLHGRRVLDVGCGTGEWAVVLASRGAEVWAVDISPGSVAVAKRRAALHGLSERVHAAVMSAMALEFPDGFFDAVHGQDIIHHMTDAGGFGREIARVLAPDGSAVFLENCANNRLLMFARDNVCGRWGIPKWSSDDEYPLTRGRLREFGRAFSTTEVEYPRFLCFFYIDAKLFRYRRKIVSRVCSGLDRLVFNVPALRQYSYRQVVRCRRGPATQPAS